MAMYKAPDLFSNPCAKAGRCSVARATEALCEHAVVRHATSPDWFITFGHCGFNSPANNGFGYRSEAAARAAIQRASRKVVA